MSIEPVVLDVLANCVVEKNRFLTDNSKTGSQVVDVEIPDVDSIDGYLSFIRVVEPLEELVNG